MFLDTTPYMVALAAYAVGAAAPGPSTLLISNTSMAKGRRHGMVLALGVVVGSVFWGLLAAGGFSYVLTTYEPLAKALRFVAALYFIYLAFRSVRSALTPASIEPQAVSRGALISDFQRGLLLHLTNPKAVFVWLATISIGAPNSADSSSAFHIVLTCAVLGLLIFCGYAFLFSTKAAQALYTASKRRIECLSAAIFGSAGAFLLANKAP